jgi:hypothetical protein
MEAELRALLTGHAALTALVAQRIYWNAIPQGSARPLIVLFRISGGPGLHSRGSDGLTNATVQIDVQALTVTSMWAIRDAVVTLLHGYQGGNFQGISLLTERQDSDELTGGGLVHRSSLDFDVWWAAPAA